MQQLPSPLEIKKIKTTPFLRSMKRNLSNQHTKYIESRSIQTNLENEPDSQQNLSTNFNNQFNHYNSKLTTPIQLQQLQPQKDYNPKINNFSNIKKIMNNNNTSQNKSVSQIQENNSIMQSNNNLNNYEFNQQDIYASYQNFSPYKINKKDQISKYHSQPQVPLQQFLQKKDINTLKLQENQTLQQLQVLESLKNEQQQQQQQQQYQGIISPRRQPSFTERNLNQQPLVSPKNDQISQNPKTSQKTNFFRPKKLSQNKDLLKFQNMTEIEKNEIIHLKKQQQQQLIEYQNNILKEQKKKNYYDTSSNFFRSPRNHQHNINSLNNVTQDSTEISSSRTQKMQLKNKNKSMLNLHSMSQQQRQFISIQDQNNNYNYNFSPSKKDSVYENSPRYEDGYRDILKPKKSQQSPKISLRNRNKKVVNLRNIQPLENISNINENINQNPINNNTNNNISTTKEQNNENDESNQDEEDFEYQEDINNGLNRSNINSSHSPMRAKYQKKPKYNFQYPIHRSVQQQAQKQDQHQKSNQSTFSLQKSPTLLPKNALRQKLYQDHQKELNKIQIQNSNLFDTIQKQKQQQIELQKSKEAIYHLSSEEQLSQQHQQQQQQVLNTTSDSVQNSKMSIASIPKIEVQNVLCHFGEYKAQSKEELGNNSNSNIAKSQAFKNNRTNKQPTTLYMYHNQRKLKNKNSMNSFINKQIQIIEENNTQINQIQRQYAQTDRYI